MSKKGGYVILDFENVKLNVEEVKNIKGISERVKNIIKTGKSILISGLNLSGEKISDFFINNQWADYRELPQKIDFSIGQNFTCHIYMQNVESYVVDDVYIE